MNGCRSAPTARPNWTKRSIGSGLASVPSFQTNFVLRRFSMIGLIDLNFTGRGITMTFTIRIILVLWGFMTLGDMAQAATYPVNQCPADRYGANLNCTANDVRFAGSPEVLAINGVPGATTCPARDAGQLWMSGLRSKQRQTRATTSGYMSAMTPKTSNWSPPAAGMRVVPVFPFQTMPKGSRIWTATSAVMSVMDRKHSPPL